MTPNPEQIERLRQAVSGKHGEVRLDCECPGGQSATLGVNADSGFYHCFRCEIKGNLNNGKTDKLPYPEWLWTQYKTTFEHPYLSKKQVPSYGLKQDQNENLVIPLSQYGQIATLQYINPQGKKVLLSKTKGGIKKASSFTIPGDIGSPKKVYVCEGYATAAAVRKVTGCTTIMAVDASNLEPVTRNLKHQYSDHEWRFAADNDANGKGLDAALKAAALVDGKVTMPDQMGQDFNDLYIERGLEAVQKQLQKYVSNQPENKFKAALISGDNLHEFILHAMSMGWRIKNIIPLSAGFIVIYGAPGDYKSFLVLDMLTHIADGRNWHGHEVLQCVVVYVAAEGGASILKRIAANMKFNGIENLDNFYLIPLPCILDEPKELDAFIAAVRPLKPGVICFDTLARSMAGNEDGTADMNRLVNACTRIIHELDCQVIIIHHTGKDESRGLRGNYSLTAATDAKFKAKACGDRQVSLICERQKDYEVFRDMIFNMEIESTGYVDEDFQPINSLVPVHDPDATPQKSRQPQIRGQTRTAFNALIKALEESGEYPSREVLAQMDARHAQQKVVHEDLWRETAYKMGISDRGQDAMRKGFNRARNNLMDNKMIACWDGYYWKI